MTLRAYQYPAIRVHAVARMRAVRAAGSHRPRLEVDATLDRSAITTRTTSDGRAALILIPRANPLRSPAYQVSTRIARSSSVAWRGTAKATAAKRVAAWARSASENVAAITLIRCEVVNRIRGTAQAPRRHPVRARSSAAPRAAMLA